MTAVTPVTKEKKSICISPDPKSDDEFEIMSEKEEEDEDPGISSLNSALIKNDEKSIFCHFVCDFLFF